MAGVFQELTAERPVLVTKEECELNQGNSRLDPKVM